MSYRDNINGLGQHLNCAGYYDMRTKTYCKWCGRRLKETRQLLSYSEYDGQPQYLVTKNCGNPTCVEGKVQPQSFIPGYDSYIDGEK